MRLPSLTQISNQSIRTFKRFPLAILCAITMTGIAIYFVETPDHVEQWPYLFNAAWTLLLGISLFTAIPLIAEKRKWSSPIKIGIHAIGFLLLLTFFFILPTNWDDASRLHLYRYILYFIGLHLLVAIAPYITGSNTNAFWQYNKTLFLRILTAILYSGVLYIGLAIALGSVEFLFNTDISTEWYIELFLFIAGILNTWFFLAGIPDPIQLLDEQTNYPKGLKIFSRNVLLPLVAIYMTIMYAYAAKIIIQWSWPQGWVSILILSFSIFGILANLLLYPIRNRTDNQWVRRFSRSYYWILLPLTILLLLAIWERISTYGVTVERYFVLVLALWLIGIVLYFIISKKQDIKTIPASLCAIVFVISFGPWGAFSVSERSQTRRLTHLLKENSILQNGTIHQAAQPIPIADAKQINSILYYLDDVHSLKNIRPWFTSSGDSTKYLTAHQAIEIMGIQSIEPYEMDDPDLEPDAEGIWLTMDQNTVLPVQNYDYWIQSIQLNTNESPELITLGNQKITIQLRADSSQTYIIQLTHKDDTLAIPINDKIQTLRKATEDSYGISPSKIYLQGSDESLSTKIYLKTVNGKQQHDTLTIQYINIGLLVSVTPSK